MLKNYIYKSTAKLNLFWSQLPPAFLRDTTAKATVNLGVIKTELEAKTTEPSDEEKLQEIISYLEASDELGTIERPKRFFRGKINARSIVDGNKIFLGGFVEINGKRKYVGLSGSIKHMLGWEYREAEKPDFNPFHRSQIGDSQVYRGGSSNEIGFSRSLTDLWKKDANFRTAEYHFEKEREERLSKLQLTDEEVSTIESKRWINPTIRSLENTFSILPILFGWIVRPFIKLLIGSRLYQAKKDALWNEDYMKKAASPEKQLENEDQDLLHFVKLGTKQIEAPSRSYEFVAITLLDGMSFDDQVILGSPLYIADTYSP